MKELLVKDAMEKNPYTVDLRLSIVSAAKIMGKKRVGCLVVTKNKKPIGIITDSDIIKKVVSKGLNPSKVLVKDVMTAPLIVANPGDTLVDAMRKMLKSRIKRLPITKGEKIIGILSYTDVVRISPNLIEFLTKRLKMRQYRPEILEETTSGTCETCGNFSENLQNVDDNWCCEECREASP